MARVQAYRDISYKEITRAIKVINNRSVDSTWHAGCFPLPAFSLGKEKKLLLRRTPLR